MITARGCSARPHHCVFVSVCSVPPRCEDCLEVAARRKGIQIPVVHYDSDGDDHHSIKHAASLKLRRPRSDVAELSPTLIRGPAAVVLLEKKDDVRLSWGPALEGKGVECVFACVMCPFRVCVSHAVFPFAHVPCLLCTVYVCAPPSPSSHPQDLFADRVLDRAATWERMEENPDAAAVKTTVSRRRRFYRDDAAPATAAPPPVPG